MRAGQLLSCKEVSAVCYTFRMSAPLDVWNFLLYCMQQLGMLLGVGGAVFLLLVYLFAVRDTRISTSEEGISRAVRRVSTIGLFIIIFSGAGITYLHGVGGQSATIFSPAYIGKWALIVAILCISIFYRKLKLTGGLIEGVAGGTWIALFLLHVIAPVTSWTLLAVSYLAWMTGFVIVWSIGIYALAGKAVFLTPREKETPTAAAPEKTPIKNSEAALSQPKPLPQMQNKEPVPKPPPVSPRLTLATPLESFPYKKPVVDQTNILHPHLTESTPESMSPPVPPARTGNLSLKDAEVTEHLPAVRVMPQTAQDLETQHRAPLVKFG